MAKNTAFTPNVPRDGVVINGSLTGTTLLLQRSEGKSDISVDLSSLSGGTGASVAGNNTEVQFNDNGSLGADSSFTFNNTTNQLNIDGDLSLSGASFLRTGTDTTSLELGLNAQSVGTGTVAIGQNATNTSGTNTVNIGSNTTTYGNSAVAIGDNSTSCINAIGIGNCAVANNACNISIGFNANASVGSKGDSSINIGRCSGRANTGNDSINIGTCSQAVGPSSVSIGTCSLSVVGVSIGDFAGKTSGTIFSCATSIGINAGVGVLRNNNICSCTVSIGAFSLNSNSRNGIVVGYAAGVYDSNAISIGASATTTQLYGVSIGYKNRVAGKGSTLIGGYLNTLNATGATAIGLSNQTISTAYNDHAIVSNLAILSQPTSGNSSQVITRNATTGVIEFTDKADIGGAGGSVTSPAGSNTEIQFNDNGSFGASSGFTFSATTKSLTIGYRSSFNPNEGLYSVSIGKENRVLGAQAVSIGSSNTVCGNFSSAFGNDHSVLGCNTHAFGAESTANGNFAFAQGLQTCACGNFSFSANYITGALGLGASSFGRLTKACGDYSFTGGHAVCIDSPVIALGFSSFNHSSNSVSQINGHGALANNSAILGGVDHNIESGNIGATIIGGNTIKLTGTTYVDTTAVANLAIISTPTSGNSSQVLTRNTATGVIEFTDKADIGGGGGGITNNAGNNEIPKSDGTDLQPSGLFNPTSGNMTLGSLSTAGSSRSIQALSSSQNVNLEVCAKSQGFIRIRSNIGSCNESTIAAFGQSTLIGTADNTSGGAGGVITTKAGVTTGVVKSIRIGHSTNVPTGNVGAQSIQINSEGILIGSSSTCSNIGFFDSTPIAKPTVNGSRSGNAALDSLLTQLANLGLIINSTTA